LLFQQVHELFPYQQAGVEWLAAHDFALLADEMGLGKSAQAIRAADLVGAKRILVVCPATARINWVREFAIWSCAPQRTVSLPLGNDALLGANASFVIISSYDYLTTNVASMNASWDLVIADESHFVKNPDALRTQALFGVIAHRTRRLWCLSGTPAPNHAAELWPMLRTFGITPGSYGEFVAAYCTSSTYKNRLNVTGTRDAAAVRTLLAPVMLRRTKEEVLPELPPISFHDHLLDATALEPHMMEYYFARRYAVREAEIIKRELREQNMLVDALKRLQHDPQAQQGAIEALFEATSTLRCYVGATKVQAVVDLLTEELDAKAYDKIVVFAVHKVVCDSLMHKLQKYKPVLVYGGTLPTRRQMAIDKFNNPKSGCRVFIGNINTAGIAINLTAAHQVFFAEYAWTPADNAQAAMRCHRIGQTKPVTVRFGVLPGGIDEVVLRVVRRKSRELAQVFDPPPGIFD
jgi:SWI/SNF-related matrix-associated actin-dependent regulator 1 of chromatin subfamily A